MNESVVFTGGGTAGHVLPNIALIEAMQQAGRAIHYIGSSSGIECQLIRGIAIPFHAIRTGKLRRYFSWQNFIDPFNICIGFIQSLILLRQLKAKLVFSKGGFVAFPVVLAAYILRIPVIAHESDNSLGLANRLSLPFIQHLCVNFPETVKGLKHTQKFSVTGLPLRAALKQGSPEKGLALTGFNLKKPCLLVMGGSLGSQMINAVVRQSLDRLCEEFQVVHLCGQGNLDETISGRKDYCQFEFIDEDMPHLYAMATVVLSRAGASTVFELLALAKPHLLIPLSLARSRGDQIKNAQLFYEQGLSRFILEEDLKPETLMSGLLEVYQSRFEISKKLAASNYASGTDAIIKLMNEFLINR